MGTRARLIAALGILIVALTACSSGSKTPPAASNTPTPTPSKSPKPTLAGDYTVTATPCVNFRKALVDSGFKLSQCCVWVKQTMVMGRQDYHWQHEPILYGWKPSGSHN